MAKIFKGLRGQGLEVTQEDETFSGDPLYKIAELARRAGDENPRSKIASSPHDVVSIASAWGEEKHSQEIAGLAKAIAILESKGMIVEQPLEKGGNYVITSHLGEVFTTRRVNDVISVATYISQGGKVGVTKKETDTGNTYAVDETGRQMNTKRPHDINWLKNNGPELVFG